jgi:hypothetical protein
MNTKSIVKNSKLPNFITGHEIFEKIDEVKKIFPLIGLKNGSESLSELNYAKFIAPKIKSELKSMFYSTRYWYNKDRAKKIYNVLSECGEKDFIVDKKLTLTPKKLKNIGVRNVKEAYYKCMYDPMDRKYAISDDEDFNHFPKINNSWKVVFSSSGDTGVWDIATMSMRGIDSCQAWDGSYKRNLIGSIIDPFVGVIYLTNNKNYYGNRGKEMLYRCVVRYVVNRTTRKPAILLEPMYTSEDNDDDYDNLIEDAVREIFKLYLQKHLTKKLPIITSPRNYDIPNSSAVEALRNCKGNYEDAVDGLCLSYRDSGVDYTKSSAVRYSKIKPF